MNVEKNKFFRFIKDGNARMFLHKLENGYKWRRAIKGKKDVDLALETLGEEVARVRDPVQYQIQMLSELLHGKQGIWMEGPTGSTTWMDAP